MKLKGKNLISMYQEKYKENKLHNIDEKHKNKSYEQKRRPKKTNGYVNTLLTN